MEQLTRPARSGDLGELKNIWKTVFGDTDAFIDAFFGHYSANNATVVQIGGDIAAAGYLLPVGSLNIPDSGGFACGMIYSVAVLPDHRSRGLGAELTRALISRGHEDGYPAVALCPANDGLFDYYAARTTLHEWFYACECTGSLVPGDGTLTRLSAAEYARARDELLSGSTHIGLDERALAFQSSICELSGGGLYAVTTPDGGEACAVIECDGAVMVKELLTRGGSVDAATAVARAFPADGYIVRSPVRGTNAGNVRRYGMLATHPALGARSDGAWYGLAFD